jgi:hypothetical protein
MRRIVDRKANKRGEVRVDMSERKKFVVSKSVYEFALKYQGCQGEISGAFPHQTFTIRATSDEFEDLFSLLRFVKTTED